MDKILLYDLPSRDPLRAWSLNPWKTRLILNYKKIDYETMWIEYPEIQPTFKKNGIPPNTEGTPYTSPCIRFPETKSSKVEWVMDSRKIADALESRYPSPLLHLDFPKLANVQATVINANVATAPLWWPRIPRNILNERSVSYFSETRVKCFGMTLDELEKSDKGGEGAWEAALPHLQELAQMLKEKGGPYFMGKTVSYADFIVAAFFQFWKRVAPDLFERLVKVDEAFPNLYESCEEWLKRDDR